MYITLLSVRSPGHGPTPYRSPSHGSHRRVCPGPTGLLLTWLPSHDCRRQLVSVPLSTVHRGCISSSPARYQLGPAPSTRCTPGRVSPPPNLVREMKIRKRPQHSKMKLVLMLLMPDAPKMPQTPVPRLALEGVLLPVSTSARTPRHSTPHPKACAPTSPASHIDTVPAG